MSCKHCSCLSPGQSIGGLGYHCSFCIQMVPRRILSMKNNTNIEWVIAARLANYLRDPATIVTGAE